MNSSKDSSQGDRSASNDQSMSSRSSRYNRRRHDRRQSWSVLTLENTKNSCMAKTILGLEKSDSSSRQDSEALEVYSPSGYAKLQEIPKMPYISGDSCISKCINCQNRPFVAPTLRVQETATRDWQVNLVTPMQRLAQLFSLEHLSDVTITFKNSDVTYKAHRLVLATASPVLERMFYSNTLEAVTGIVELHCSHVAIKWILDNLYLGCCNLESVSTALLVFGVAQMYQMTGIAALCSEYLKFGVTLGTVSEVFEVALTHDEEDLIAACLKKLCSSWQELLKEHIAEITEEIWFYLLNKSVLPTTEVQLLKGLVLWGKSELEADNESPTPDKIRQRIQKFLPKLRLLSIPSEKFIDVVMPTNVFTPEECSKILMKIRGASVSLPGTVNCSLLPYGRIRMTFDTLKYVVLTRVTEGRKSLPSLLSEITLIKEFSASNPVMLDTIQTQESSTLKNAQMIMIDNEGKEIGIAKALGANWKFTSPVYMHANRPYTVIIDRALVSKTFTKRDFNAYTSDIRFRGVTGDNYLKLAFWPANVKQ